MDKFSKISAFLLLALATASAGFAGKRPAHKPVKRKPAARKMLPRAPQFPYVGDIVYVKGPSVEAERANHSQWISAYLNMPDYLQDKIKTDPSSISTLEFANGTQIGINKDTEVTIDTETSVKNTGEKSILRKIKLAAGTVWCKVTHQTPNEGFTVETRGGVLGVRGTEFVVSTTGDDKMEVYVMEGTVMAGPNADQLTQAIIQGQEATVEDGRVTAVKVMNAVHDVLDVFPGLDPSGNIREGLGFASFAVEASYDPGMAAADLALDYIPYGGVVREVGGWFGAFGGGRPQQPENLQPSGLAETYTPVFSWKGIGNAKQYSVLLSKSPFRKDMPKGDIFWSGRVDATTVAYPDTAPFLSPGATYYWAVVGLDDHGKVVGKGSNPAAFTLAGENVLGKRDIYPEVLHPMNETLPDDLPAFSWNPMTGASGYAVIIGSRVKDSQVDPDSLIAVIQAKNTNAAYELKDRPLLPGATYYWSVRPVDAEGHAYAEPSPPVSFTVAESSMLGPRPVFPVDAMKSATPFHAEWRGWNENISGYKFTLSDNRDLSNPLIQQNSQTPWIDLPDLSAQLSAGKTYYWSVSTINLDGTAGKTGPTASFAVVP